MIYRMTSVNPSKRETNEETSASVDLADVPVFRVRTATAPSPTNTMIKTEAKPISMATTTSMCYEPKPTHPAAAPSGSVSVLACFKTTKKRNKVRDNGED